MNGILKCIRMNLTFATATTADAAELAALHAATSEDLTRRFGPGF